MLDNPFITIGLPPSLFVIMVGMGLGLTAADFKRVVEQPRAVAIGILAVLLVIPLFGFALAWGFTEGGVLAAGLILLAALPGGTTSNMITHLARANVALSITMTVIASLATVLTIPFWMNLGLEQFSGGGQDIQLPFVKTLVTMVVILILPVGIGMLINRSKPDLAKRVEPFINLFSTILLVSLVAIIVYSEWDNLGGWIAACWLPVTLFNFGSLAIGMLAGKATGLPLADSLTITVEVGIKNVTIGLTVALTLIGNVELAIPCAVYGLLMYFTAFALAGFGRAKLS